MILERSLTQKYSQVNIFFDGVSARINAGVKEAEISYQLQFSKQELKKVVHAYPGREVRAGLEKLYKKVEKHLSEEENLLQVVWHHMQEEFIRQYKYIEDLLQRCYPGAQICLDFTMEDILEYFSGIAMHHWEKLFVCLFNSFQVFFVWLKFFTLWYMYDIFFHFAVI